MLASMEKIALIGYGVVGHIFGAALARPGVREVRAYDPRARSASDGVVLAPGPAEAALLARGGVRYVEAAVIA